MNREYSNFNSVKKIFAIYIEKKRVKVKILLYIYNENVHIIQEKKTLWFESIMAHTNGWGFDINFK